MKTTISFIICLMLSLTIASSAAYASSEIDASAQRLAQLGIIEGDQNGSLNLEKSLTRAELAVILTRLDFSDAPGGLAEWREWGAAHFSEQENRYNKFTDVPNWALPYVEYCYQRGLMKGVGDGKFDPQGQVSPQMACTVALRYCGVAETDWDYQTSVTKAQNIGLVPIEGVNGGVILRGVMVDIIRRALDYGSNNRAPNVAEALQNVPSSLVASPQPQKPSPATSVEQEPSSATLINEQEPSPVLSIDEMKAEIVRLTNAERAKIGLPALEVLPELMECAQAKAADMKNSNYYGHNSPVYGTADEMIFRFVPQAATAAENIAAWGATPQEAFTSWMDSSKGHRETILTARLTHIGIGIAYGADGGYWWVQQFVRL